MCIILHIHEDAVCDGVTDIIFAHLLPVRCPPPPSKPKYLPRHCDAFSQRPQLASPSGGGVPPKLRLPNFDNDIIVSRQRLSLHPAHASTARDAVTSRSSLLKMPRMPSADSDDDDDEASEGSWIDGKVFAWHDDDETRRTSSAMSHAGNAGGVSASLKLVATPKKRPTPNSRTPATPAAKRSVSCIAEGLNENRAPLPAPIALLVRTRPELSISPLREQPFDDRSSLGKRTHGASRAMFHTRF